MLANPTSTRFFTTKDVSAQFQILPRIIEAGRLHDTPLEPGPQQPSTRLPRRAAVASLTQFASDTSSANDENPRISDFGVHLRAEQRLGVRRAGHDGGAACDFGGGFLASRWELGLADEKRKMKVKVTAVQKVRS
jgi:hypothetical protein